MLVRVYAIIVHVDLVQACGRLDDEEHQTDTEPVGLDEGADVEHGIEVASIAMLSALTPAA